MQYNFIKITEVLFYSSILQNCLLVILLMHFTFQKVSRFCIQTIICKHLKIWSFYTQYFGCYFPNYNALFWFCFSRVVAVYRIQYFRGLRNLECDLILRNQWSLQFIKSNVGLCIKISFCNHLQQQFGDAFSFKVFFHLELVG